MSQSQPPNQIGFDDIPIPAVSHSHNQFDIPQFAQSQNRIDHSNLTLIEKLSCKGIKTRMEGLQQLHDLLEKTGNNKKVQNQQILMQVKMNKVLKENNPACIEKALICMKDWIQLQRNWGNAQIKQAIQSGYINGKGNAKKCSIQVIQRMFQTKPQQCEQAILEGLKIKTPKIIGGYLGVINQLLQALGIKMLKYLKPYITDIVRIMNTEKLPAVKNQAMNLVKAGYKWVGKQFFSQYTKDLKQNIQKQLQNFWQTHDKNEKMVSKKETHKKVQICSKTQNRSQSQAINCEQPKQSSTIDLYQISEPIDVLKQFDQKWTDSVLSAEKWSIKVKLLQDCQSKFNVPKVSHRECRHIIQMIRRLLTDSNFNVVLNTLKLAGLMAKSLRKFLTHSVKILFPLVLPKFRDKKTQMIEETFSTLHNFAYSVSIQDILQDIKVGLKDKTPSAKQHLIVWMTQYIQKRLKQSSKFSQKTFEAFNSLQSYFDKLIIDSSSDVREVTTKLITLLKQQTNLTDLKLSGIQCNTQKNLQKSINDRSKSTGKSRKLSHSKNKSQVNSSKIVQYDGDIVDLVNDFPRILKKLNDSSNWQNRKQAVEDLLIKFEKVYATQAKLPNSSIIHDFLGIVKSRVSDPNKQLIKIFIRLIGQTFLILSQKEAKTQYRPFVQTLAEALSDKNQANKKQIFKSFDILGEVMGQQNIIAALNNSCLNQNNFRVYCFEYMLIWEETLQNLSKNELKQFPKSIISGLCDKNRQIKSKSENILKIIAPKLSIDVFKNIIKDVKPAFKNQLNNILDKYYPNTNTSSSLLAQSSFYSNKSINKNLSRKASPSASKHDLNKSKYGQRSHSKIKDNYVQQNSSQYNSRLYNNSSIIKNNNYLNDNDIFAPINILTQERLQREQKQQKYRHTFSAINFWEQNRTDIAKLFNNQQFAQKMLADDYRLNIQGSLNLIKICRDSSQHNSLRQLYDIILKWVCIKLYGGNPAFIQLIQVIPPILSILEKKKIAFTDKDIDLIFQIIREYVLASHFTESISYQTLKSIMMIGVALSSGQRLLKKILFQFKYDYQSTHRHCRKHTNQIYKSVLKYLCIYLSDYFNNDTLLMQASKIDQLCSEPDFYKKLKQKFHQNILKEFGFDNEGFSNEYYSIKDQSLNKEDVKNSFFNSKPNLLHSRNKQRSKSKNKNSNNLQNFSSPFDDQSQNPHFGQVSDSVWPQPSQKIYSRNSSTNYLKSANQDIQKSSVNYIVQQQHRYATLQGDCNCEIDLSSYPAINYLSPLGNNIKKLYPPNQQTIGFFTALMQENSQKITQQLSRNCNTIYGSIFNSLIRIFKNRNEFSPQKIISFTNLVQLSIRCVHIFKKIQHTLISHTCQFIVNQLVYQDQNRSAIEAKLHERGYTDLKSDCFIKAINGIMLRILDHTPPLFTVNILLQMLTILNSKKNVNSHTTNKKLGLIIRCITRVSSTYFNPSAYTYSYQNEKGDKMILNFFCIAKDYLDLTGIMSLVSAQKKYGQSIQKNSKSEQSITQTVYNILHVISKQVSSQGKCSIWNIYNNFKSDILGLRQQILIKQYLQHIIGPQQKYEEPIVMNSYVLNEHKIQKNNKMNDELRQIIELLAKTRTFQSGIENLKQFVNRNKTFDLDKYFNQMNFDKNFIQKVKNQLKSLPNHSQKSNNLNPDIQNKLEHLKKKLQIMQVKAPGDTSTHKRDLSAHRVEKISRGQNLTPKNKRDYSNNGQKVNTHREQNHNDVKKRIEDMKNRIHMTATNRIR